MPNGNNFMERYVVVRVDEPSRLTQRAESEGPAFLFGFEASEYKTSSDYIPNVNDCGELVSKSTVVIDGVTATRCYGESTLYGPGALTIKFKRGNVYYSILSYRYTGLNQDIVDGIIDSIRLF